MIATKEEYFKNLHERNLKAVTLETFCLFHKNFSLYFLFRSYLLINYDVYV